MSGKQQSQRLKVYLRQKPFATADAERNIIDSATEKDIKLNWKNQTRKFKVDHIFGEGASQHDIYNKVVTPYINDAISGYNCTVLAYGPTGTGKTYTIWGENLEFPDSSTVNESFGIIPRVAKDLFIGLDKLFDMEYTLRISFVEIYNEEVRDLLKEHSILRIFDDPTNKNATYFKGLREVTLCTLDDFFDWLIIGQQELRTAAIKSSRSHTVFTFSINTQKYTGGELVLKSGKLQFVDLAGNEHIQRSNAFDLSAKEVANINKSIFTLNNVIKALAHKQPHVPYRDCKLTRVLQESLGGNAKTSMIATFLPMTQTVEETVAALETAAAARSIVNSPIINITRQPNDVYLEEELSKLKKDLAAAQNKVGCCMTSSQYQKMSKKIAGQDRKRRDLIDQIRKLEDFQQTISDDYIKLMLSFEITKETLKEKEEELEKTSEAVQEQEEIVKRLEEHDAEATEAVDTRSKICETMLDDKMTYHEKYDKQQDITKRNADDALLLINNCLDGLEKIKVGYHNYTEGLESRITQLGEFNNPIASRNKEILKINDFISREVFEKTNSAAAQLSGLFEEFNTDLSVETFKNIQEHIQKTDGILENLQQTILLHNHDQLAKDKNFQKIIDKQLTAKEHFFTDSQSQFDKLNKNFEDANVAFEKKVQLDSQFNKTFMQYFQQNEDLSQNFEKHTKSMGDSIHNCSLLTEAFQDEAKHANLNQLTIDYINYLESIDSDKQQAVNHLQKKMNKTKANYSHTITSQTEALKVHNNQMKNTIEQRVDASNNETLKMFNDWSERTSTVSSRLEESRDGLAEMQKDVEDLDKNEAVDFEKNLDVLLEEARELGDQLKNAINYATHDGDTPPKRTPNFPEMPKLEQHRLAALFDEPEDSEDPQ